MNFEWDNQKSNACYEQRGFDFLFVTKAFFDLRRVVLADERRSYGEHRYQLFGKIEHRFRRDLHAASRRGSHNFGPQGKSKGDQVL